MLKKQLTREQLISENKDLRAQLEKAQAALSDASRSGVDAIIFSNEPGAPSFTLMDEDRSYRTLVENMSEGALTLTHEGLVLYANRRFAKMLKAPLEKVIGSYISNWFVPESSHVIQKFLQNESMENHRNEFVMNTLDKTLVPVYLSVNRVALMGTPDFFGMVVTDLTKQKHYEAILAQEKLTSSILEQAADAIIICDSSGRITRFSKKAQSFCSENLAGQRFEQALPLHRSDGTILSCATYIKTKGRRPEEMKWERNGELLYFLVSIGQLRDEENTLLGSVITMTDITEKKKADIEILTNEKRLTEAQSMAKIGYWEYETATDEFIFNDQYYKLHKITASEAGGYRMSTADFVHNYVHPDDAATVSQNVQLALESKDPNYFVRIESRILTGKGEIIWVEVRFRIVKDQNGNTIRMIGVNQDITQRKMAELKLIESERRFTDLLGNVELLSMMRDREERITYCNEYLLRLTGWQYNEIIGKNWIEIFLPPEIIEEKKKVFADILENKPQAMHHESEILTCSGDRRLIRWNNTVLKSENGEVIGTASIGEDITDRKKSEAALAESELRFRQISENIKEVFFLINPQMSEVFYVSPAYEEIWGRSCESLYERPAALFIDAIHPDDQVRVIREIAPQGTLKPFDIEFKIIRPHGITRVIRARGFPILNNEGEIYRFAGIAEDITEQYHTELQLLQSQKMEAIGLLSGGVAHDFNNLLTVILGHVEILLMSKPADDVFESVIEIKKAGDRAAALTRQLLLFGRRQSMEMKLLDLNNSLVETTKMLKRILGEDIDLEFRPNKTGTLMVEADAGMLDQVLMNLAVNARDAMPEGGRLLIETALVEFDEESIKNSKQLKVGSFACLSVSDSGTGISPEILPRIFDPFFTTKDIGRGTGLGLTTVFGIIKQHNGWINVYSEVGQGTTFRIYLPITKIEIESGSTAASAEVKTVQKGKGETILVVEDENAVSALVSAYLSNNGYKILTAASGSEALEVFKNNKNDIRLVFTDIIMPGEMTGIALGALLRAEQPALKIIFTSGYSDLRGVQDIVLEEGKNFIHKPYPLSDVALLLRSVLDEVSMDKNPEVKNE